MPAEQPRTEDWEIGMDNLSLENADPSYSYEQPVGQSGYPSDEYPQQIQEHAYPQQNLQVGSQGYDDTQGYYPQQWPTQQGGYYVDQGYSNAHYSGEASNSRTRPPTVKEARRYPDVERSKEWLKGRIFEMTNDEVRGQGWTVTLEQPSQADLFSKTALWLIFKTPRDKKGRTQGFSKCIRINSYNGRGCLKNGADPACHGIIYDSNYEPVLLEGEEGLGYTPVAADMYKKCTLIKSSRIHYGKYRTIEHNIPVRFIGELSDYDIYGLRQHLRSANEMDYESDSENEAAQFQHGSKSSRSDKKSKSSSSSSKKKDRK